VIACRITAENPLKGFQPTSGNIQELSFRSIPNVWGYFSVSSGGGVHEFADSQIGHLFAWGPDRDTCRSTIILGLKELSIRGEISTPVDYLIRLMETPEFCNNTADTAWLDSRIANGEAMVKPHSLEDESNVVICGAICQAFRNHANRKQDFISQLAAGRVPTKQLLQLTDRVVITYSDVEYKCDVKACGPETYAFQLVAPSATPAADDRDALLKRSVASISASEKSGPIVMVEVRPFADGGLLVIFNGKSRHCYLTANPPVGWKLVIDKNLHILENQRDPTKIFAPSNGKIVRYLVQNGARVKAGTAFVECEIMKMILPVVCEIDGALFFTHSEGSVLEAGDLIARVEPDDLSSVRKAKPFQGTFPAVDPSVGVAETKPYLLWLDVQRKVEHVMTGFSCVDPAALVQSLLAALLDPKLPLSWFQHVLSEHKASLQGALKTQLDEICSEYEKELALGKTVPFPSSAMLNAVQAHAQGKLSDSERGPWLANVSGLTSTLKELGDWDVDLPEKAFVSRQLSSYLEIERKFNDRPQEVVFMEMRDAHKGALDAVYRVSLAYHSEESREAFLCQLLSELARRFRVASYKKLLHEIYVSPRPRHVRLSLVAGSVLSRPNRSSPEESRRLLFSELEAIGEDLAEDVLLPRVLDVLMRAALPLETVAFAHVHVLDRPRLAGAIMREYISMLIALLPFQEVKTVLAEKAPRLTLKWVTAPVDVTDQGLPEQGSKVALASSAEALLDVPASALKSSTGPSASRHSMAYVFESCQQAKDSLTHLLNAYEAPNDATTRNILMLVLLNSDVSLSSTASGDRTTSEAANRSAEQLLELLKPHVAKLIERRIVRVTVVVGRANQAPLFHTFRLRHSFSEDRLYRNFVPELGFLLELRRLDKYELELCATESSRVLVYSALERLAPGSGRSPASRERRLFVRSFVNIEGLQPVSGTEVDLSSSAFHEFFQKNEGLIKDTLGKTGQAVDTMVLLRMLLEVESVFVESLNLMEHTIMNRRQTPSDTNSLFIALMTRVTVSKTLVMASIPIFMRSFGARLAALSVHLVEFVLTTPASAGNRHESHRFVVSFPSGVLWRLSVASESRALGLGVPSPRMSRASSAGAQSEPNITSSEALYEPTANVSSRRRHCRLLNTTYVYDLLDVLERALLKQWARHRRNHGQGQPKSELLSVTELRLDGNEKIQALPALPAIGLICSCHVVLLV
jgi:biotin carboxyl carrier protein